MTADSPATVLRRYLLTNATVLTDNNDIITAKVYKRHVLDDLVATGTEVIILGYQLHDHWTVHISL